MWHERPVKKVMLLPKTAQRAASVHRKKFLPGGAERRKAASDPC